MTEPDSSIAGDSKSSKRRCRMNAVASQVDISDSRWDRRLRSDARAMRGQTRTNRQATVMPQRGREENSSLARRCVLRKTRRRDNNEGRLRQTSCVSARKQKSPVCFSAANLPIRIRKGDGATQAAMYFRRSCLKDCHIALSHCARRPSHNATVLQHQSAMRKRR